MRQGKEICETLKGIRREIASANEIEYNPTECNHEGDCTGTCPKCESETRWLEKQLRSRQALGKAVTIAGLSVALGAMSSCHKIIQPNGYLEPNLPQDTRVQFDKGGEDQRGKLNPTVNENNDSIDQQRFQLMGDVAMPVVEPEPERSNTPKTTTGKKNNTTTNKKSSTKKKK